MDGGRGVALQVILDDTYSNKAYDVSPYSRLWRRIWKIPSRCFVARTWKIVVVHARMIVYTLCPLPFFNDSASTERSRRISPSYIATAAVISCTAHGFIAVGWSVDTLMYMTMYATSVKLRNDAQHSLTGRSPAPRGSPKFLNLLWPSPAVFNSEEHIEYTTLFTYWCMTKMHFQIRDEHYI